LKEYSGSDDRESFKQNEILKELELETELSVP
jgi:hypothetical protein